ncbi:uncharacterized protein MKZ38_005298 [Zalerion maritima]|uniref:Uncharacterized protein n=1 Tax=Zalerion maritima TaxID=339359 RepID=A0AAD5RLC0_9PEZI|nr:uncharacterized protein MKZ38_005298 [Zalerion maritima]
MAPSSPRSPHAGLRSPPPSSPPAQPPKSGHARGAPSITPRRFRRFFTPRTRLSSRSSASRRALHDLAGPALNRFQTPSSPLKPLHESNVDSGRFTAPRRAAKRRRIADTPPASSPLALESSPVLRPSGFTRPELLSPLNALPQLDSDDDMGCDHDDHPEPLNPVAPLARRGLAGHRLQRELAAIPRAGHSILRFPVADYQMETADFCSTPDEAHTNISHDGFGNCIPFCVTGCNTNSLVAVGDEEGRVRLLDSAEKPEYGGFDKIYVQFRPHSNAIIDMDFSSDDSLLATASGDQTGRVIDMMTQTPLSLLAHHTASLKQVKFQPGKGSNSVLATSSRDGSIQIWDLRCKGGPVQELAVERQTSLGFGAPRRINPGCVVNSIYDAHLKAYRPSFINAPTSLDTPNRGEGIVGSTQRLGEVSVTAIQFMPAGKEHLLLSGCEADASIKLWDIRSIHTSRHKTTAAPLSYTTPPDSHTQWRPFGIGSLALGGDGSRLYALCKDSTVYAYSTAHLMLGHAPELSMDAPRRRQLQTEQTLGPVFGFRHDSLHAGSFYVKCSVRPAKDGRSEILAVGSSSGSPLLFPTNERYQKEQLEKNKLQERQESTQELASQNPFGSRQLPHRRTLFRTNSMSSMSGRSADTIPICQNGTALTRGHNVEVGAVSWTNDGKLVSVGDDYLVRCWGERRDEARELRTCGEAGGRRWNSGWAVVSEDYDEED